MYFFSIQREREFYSVPICESSAELPTQNRIAEEQKAEAYERIKNVRMYQEAPE